MSPWGCSFLCVLDVSYVSVGTELLKLPGVVLLHFICLGLLCSFSLPGFHFSTELQRYGLYSLLKMFRESKWEHKFCISKGRNGPIVLHRVELLLFFLYPLQKHLSESRPILSPVLWLFNILSWFFLCRNLLLG